MRTKNEAFDQGRKAGIHAGEQRGAEYVKGEERAFADQAADQQRFPVPSYRAAWVDGFARGYRVGVRRTSPKKPKASGTNIHNSERGTKSVLVRMDPALVIEARMLLAETKMTWAELIRLGMDAKRKEVRA